LRFWIFFAIIDIILFLECTIKMPIKIPTGLPARETLEQENIFVMDECKAIHQDIRPLQIAILNLMPTKITTENQLIRLLSNTPLQIELTLLGTASHTPKHTSAEHMSSFYKNYYDVKNQKFDGLVITGAPVEDLEFEDVDYWPELCEVMEWSKTNVFSTFHICWAAQAALYYHYGVKKYPLQEKLFGVFPHTVNNPKHPLVRGFNEIFLAPHSRHTEIHAEDIIKIPELEILSSSQQAGVYIISEKSKPYRINDDKFVDRYAMCFITGHSEYDNETLANEYFRDLNKGLPIKIPYNYFTNDNPQLGAPNTWRAHSHLLFANWLNYFVYQETPYNIDEIK